MIPVSKRIKYCDLVRVAREREVAYELDEAKQSYIEASRLLPDLPVAYAALGRIAQLQGEYGDATKNFRKLSEMRDGSNGRRGKEARCHHVGKRFSAFKIRHDREQIEYLLRRERIRMNRDVRDHLEALGEVLQLLKSQKLTKELLTLNEDLAELLGPFYDRMLYLKPRKRLKGHAINPRLNFRKMEEAFLKSKPRAIFLDDFLTEECLQTLRDHCLESMVWTDVKTFGLINSSVFWGFANEAIYQVAEEAADRMPRIFRDQRLIDVWGYKYEEKCPGLWPHADMGNVTLNMWLTPSSANRDPESGGVWVYDAYPPDDWTVGKFNALHGPGKSYLRSKQPAKVRIPYRENRAVIFDAMLFHQSEPIDFFGGYENRRINTTYQFGDPPRFPGISRAWAWKRESRLLEQAFS
jgi:tetratricopeptide (TPR) repeat protein